MESNHQPQLYEGCALTVELRRLALCIIATNENVGMRYNQTVRLSSFNHKGSNFPILIFIVLIVLIINSAKSISGLRSSVNRLESAKKELTNLKEENKRLQNNIEYVQTEEYIEKAALEQLNLTKEGYTILIMETETPTYRENLQEKAENKEIIQNWKLWAKTFGL